MKMLTKQGNRRRTDWEAVKKFVEEIFPNLKSDLEKSLINLNIQKSFPFIIIDKYPPRISLIFNDNGFEEGVDKELKSKQEKISEVVAIMGKKYNLNTMAGLVQRICIREGIHENRVSYRTGFYTFKPKYEKFRI